MLSWATGSWCDSCAIEHRTEGPSMIVTCPALLRWVCSHLCAHADDCDLRVDVQILNKPTHELAVVLYGTQGMHRRTCDYCTAFCDL